MADDITTPILVGIRDELRANGTRLEKIEGRLENVEGRLDSQSVRFEQVHGIVQQLSDQTANGQAAAAEQARAHHAEQMKAFQSVVEEVRAGRDEKIRSLEADVSRLKEQMAQLLARKH